MADVLACPERRTSQGLEVSVVDCNERRNKTIAKSPFSAKKQLRSCTFLMVLAFLAFPASLLLAHLA
jgi:hypothetical protein